jgi:predicted enzyme related to lactoylglutathione lyase
MIVGFDLPLIRDAHHADSCRHKPASVEAPIDTARRGVERIDDACLASHEDAPSHHGGLADGCPGSDKAILQLRVRDVEAMAKTLKAAGAEIISEGGHAVSMGATKLVLVRDPNNPYLELLPAPQGR